MSLSERLRPEVEAAPWVIEEVKKLEEELDAARMAVHLVKKETARLRGALQRIAMRCPNCDEGDEYATCMCFSEPFADQIARAALEGG